MSESVSVMEAGIKGKRKERDKMNGNREETENEESVTIMSLLREKDV